MVAPTLIDCWHVRDLQRFRAILKGGSSDKGSSAFTGAGSAGYSRSPHSLKESSGPCPPSEVNRRDHFGRTVLHLVASNIEPWSVDYLYAILAHPSVNVNLQDSESGWTPLHRALYLANLQTAIVLLRRSDTDTRLKDLEGLTPFDLYNSTVNGTNPPPDALSYDQPQHAHGRTLTQLFTWGSNRNYNLGLGDGDDRQLPDRVNLKRSQSLLETPDALPAGKKFDRIGIKDIAMSRLHTVVLTDETVSNVWVCGLGGNGRLGRSPQTQTSFEPLKDFPEAARLVSAAHDHTLIVTASGAVYSFGLNRFAQLGYVIEQGFGTVASTSGKIGGGAGIATFGQTSTTSAELDVQISPRRIVGPLKKEIVLGAACSKLHSAVFTAEGLYTWGTNTGQLGYDRSGTAIQVQPRRVTALVAGSGIQQIAATEFGTACLLEGGNVFLWHNDTHVRVSFPLARFSIGFSDSRIRPGNAQSKTLISKLSSSGNTFSALSDVGDLFTFNLEHPSEYGNSAGGRTPNSKTSAAQLGPKPQLVWSVRKKFSAVRDVAIGADGSVILCTESGHCFVRPQRSDGGGSFSKASGKGFKFQQVPFLQRVVKVALSESGGLAAIKADPSLPDVRIRGRTIEEALRDLLPHLKVQTITEDSEHQQRITSEVVEIAEARSESDGDSESDVEETEVGSRSNSGRYLRMALLILEAYKRWASGRNVYSSEIAAISPSAGQRRGFYGPHNLDPPFGCDVFLIAGGHYLPAHRTILAARIPCLRQALSKPSSKLKVPTGIKVSAVNERVATLTLSYCSLATSLFFLHYIYSDDLPPIWVPSVGLAIEKELKAAKIERTQVQEELVALADLLELSALSASTKANVPRQPTPSLRANMEILFKSSVDIEDPDQSLFHDVLLQFEDRNIPAHSAILRRSPFFAALFQPHWTADRWDPNFVITLNMQHCRWEVARIVLLHLYTDNGEILFRTCDAGWSLEQYMDFLVEIMAAANELLLDKLKLVASSLLRKRILAHTSSAVMTESAFYNADQLKEITMNYCTRNMETLLEGGMLNELEYSVLRSLTQYVRKKQDEKLRRTLASDRVAALIEAHREYYNDLDIPPPSLHLVVNKVQPRKGLPKLRSPPFAPYDAKSRARQEAMSPTTLTMRPSGMPRPLSSAGNDTTEVFSMDEDDAAGPQRDVSNGIRSGSVATGSPWGLLPQVAQLSLDDSAERAASPSRSSRSLRVGSDASPALRPLDNPGDLRSIMAREQLQRIPSGTTPLGSGASTPIPRSVVASVSESSSPITNVNARMSQKERKRQQMLQQEATSATNAVQAQAMPVKPQNSTSASPWKLSGAGSSLTDGATPTWSLKAAGTTAMALSGSQEGSHPTGSLLSFSRSPAAPLPSSNAASGSTTVGLGPTYAPARMGSAAPPKRMLSGNDTVWATPSLVSPAAPPNMTTPIVVNRSRAVQSVDSPSNLHRSRSSAHGGTEQKIETSKRGSSVTPASPSTQLTFAQIQEQQRIAIETENDQMRSAAAAKRSFLDIQEEERKAEERRREEEKQANEFEKWFAEESKRVQGTKKPSTKSGTGASSKSKSAKKQASTPTTPSLNKASKPDRGEGGSRGSQSKGKAHKASGSADIKSNAASSAIDERGPSSNINGDKAGNLTGLPAKPTEAAALSAAAPTFQPR